MYFNFFFKFEARSFINFFSRMQKTRLLIFVNAKWVKICNSFIPLKNCK